MVDRANMDRKDSPSSPSYEQKNSVAIIWTACSISFLMTYLVYTRNVVFGSEYGHWVYPYLENVPNFPLWIILVVFVLLGGFIFLGSKLIQRYEKITLLASLLNAIVIQSLMRLVYPISMRAIVLSDGTNSFYTPATQFSALDILSKFNLLAPTFPLHARTNMPGKILLFQFFRLFTSSPEVMGYLVIVLSSLGGLLVYGVCRKLFQDKRVAFYALTLYVLIPGKLFFFPVLNTVTPLFILLCFYLFLMVIEKKRNWIAWLLGAAFYFLILFEPSPLTTGLLFIGILVYAFRDKRITHKDFWRLLLHTTLGFLGVYAVILVIFSFNLVQSFLYVLKDAVNFNITYDRGYRIWLVENIKEFFFSAGLPVMILFIYIAAQTFSQSKRNHKTGLSSIENILVVSLLITLGIITLLGVNRGEVTRLWIYLAVFFQIPVAAFIARSAVGEVPLFVVAGTLAVQILVTLHRVGFMMP